MRAPVRPAIVICLAMVLVVGLVSGLTAIVCALVVPTWHFAAVVVTTVSARAADAVEPLRSSPVRSTAGLRAPPALARS